MRRCEKCNHPLIGDITSNDDGTDTLTLRCGNNDCDERWDPHTINPIEHRDTIVELIDFALDQGQRPGGLEKLQSLAQAVAYMGRELYYEERPKPVPVPFILTEAEMRLVYAKKKA